MKRPRIFQKKDKNDPSKDVKPKKLKIEKKPSNNRKVAFSRKKANRVASIIFFSVIALSLLFNIIFFSKYQTIRNSVKAQEHSIEERLGEVGKADMIQSDAIVSYTRNFLNTHFSIPEGKGERKERIESLSRYYVQGFDTSTLKAGDFSGSRSIQEMRYLETDRLNQSKAKVHYNVTYEVVEDVGKDEPVKVMNTVEVVVPIVTNGEGYAVYEHVRLIQQDLKATIESEKRKLEGESVTSTEQQEIKAFLGKFFTSYGVSDDKLPFMAAVERGLSNQVFQTLSIQQLVATEEGYQLIVDVTYQDQETSLNNVYTYELVLSQTNEDNNNYFVESIQ